MSSSKKGSGSTRTRDGRGESLHSSARATSKSKKKAPVEEALGWQALIQGKALVEGGKVRVSKRVSGGVKSVRPKAGREFRVGKRLVVPATRDNRLSLNYKELLTAARARMAEVERPVIRVPVVAAATELSFSPGLQEVLEADAVLSARTRQLADEVSFTVTTTTHSREPIQAARGRMWDVNLDAYRPNESARDKAIDRLEKLGFKICRVGRFGITVRGPARLVNEVMDDKLMVMRQTTPGSSRAASAFTTQTMVPTPGELFLAPANSLSCRPKIDSAHIDHFVFAPPALLFSTPAAVAPGTSYHSLTQGLLRENLRVPAAGAFSLLTGDAIKIGVIDTGFDASHPFYVANSSQLFTHASPEGAPGSVDPHGHGTAIVSNIFAVAPRAQVHGIRQANPPYQDAVELAVEELGVDILSCSWGWDREQSFPVLEATLRSIVEDDGKIVLFASGNGQYSWPGSMPSVISIGGVFADANGNVEASDYASGYLSSLYPPRLVPDVSGLCGLGPKGVYIPMPCPWGCTMDHAFTGNAFPDGDGTSAIDGWVVASGTSSATPQVAGVLALLLEACRAKGTTLTPALARELLQQSARKVTRGRNAFGFPATNVQPNSAVGWGLVDVGALLSLAQTRNLV